MRVLVVANNSADHVIAEYNAKPMLLTVMTTTWDDLSVSTIEADAVIMVNPYYGSATSKVGELQQTELLLLKVGFTDEDAHSGFSSVPAAMQAVQHNDYQAA